MPSCSKAKNPRGIQITFTEEDHKYRSIINGSELIYTSGTQFLGRFYPPFDPTGEITARCARKRGISVAQIKAEWDAKGKESCRLGTRTHETIEDVLLKRQFRNTAEDEDEAKRFKNAIDIGQKIYSRLSILGVEKIVFSDRLRIAGTIDLFAQSRNSGDYIIIDHKTNAEIAAEGENQYNKFCLAPIDHLPDTNFYHYAAQLNLYEFLLKYEGYVPKESQFKLFLNHVTKDKAELIKLPDLQSEVKDMIIDYLILNPEIKAAKNDVKLNAQAASVVETLDSL